ncbi:tRNA lysidine(34) synthetase TilS [Piscinibacter gummiphilus]
MAASRTPATAEPAPRIAVAYSAGRDSTALLHATATAAVGQGVEVLALHIHHGLSPHADDWLAHAQRQCARWRRQGLPVRLCTQRLTHKPATGESVEAWARRERYRALREMALQEGATLVLLAHHQRDQAETLLLQALRGAGVAGLAGMPETIEREGVTWTRPWLQQSRSAIEAYVRHHRLRFVDDDSNDQPRFARNRLRLDVWPALVKAFPQAEASLADAATWAAQATDALAELAAMDLADIADARGLKVNTWRTLSAPRQVNALRTWFQREAGALPSSTLLQRLQSELPGAGDAQWQSPQGTLHRRRGRLAFVPAAGPVMSAPESLLHISGPGRYPLPGWGGELVATRVRQDGVHPAWLARIDLRRREGGEQFMAGVGRPARSLKKQYQAADVPAWERDGPLLYSGGQLVFVPGLGIDARVLALPGQPQLRLRWQRG